jgi:hypothetical protein
MFEGGSINMMRFTKWVGAVTAIVVLAGTSMAGEAIYAGTVKSVDAAKKEAVCTADGKDTTFKLADKFVIDRAGKESNDLKPGDSVNILYDKGVLTWTARFILVKEGDYKFCELERGNFKAFDADKRALTISDDAGHDTTFAMGDAKLHVNTDDAKPETLKIGDIIWVIVEKMGDKVNVKAVMAERTK